MSDCEPCPCGGQKRKASSKSNLDLRLWVVRDGLSPGGGKYLRVDVTFLRPTDTHAVPHIEWVGLRRAATRFFTPAEAARAITSSYLKNYTWRIVAVRPSRSRAKRAADKPTSRLADRPR